jgi:hypothetical protein
MRLSLSSFICMPGTYRGKGARTVRPVPDPWRESNAVSAKEPMDVDAVRARRTE